LRLLLDYGADLDCLDGKGRKLEVYIDLCSPGIYTKLQNERLTEITLEHRSSARAKPVAQARSAALAGKPVTDDSNAVG